MCIRDSISTDPEDVYGALGFGYPLPEEYTATFDYPNHNGFDISAPENTEIYSIDDGTVGFAGYFYKCGYYISIINNTYDPTKSTASPIITRYLHMNSQDSMLVGEDEPEMCIRDSSIHGQNLPTPMILRQ